MKKQEKSKRKARYLCLHPWCNIESALRLRSGTIISNRPHGIWRECGLDFPYHIILEHLSKEDDLESPDYTSTQ
jgi:hypothetical protein